MISDCTLQALIRTRYFGLLYLVAIFFSGCGAAPSRKTVQEQSGRLIDSLARARAALGAAQPDRIVISYVDPGIETVVSVDCDHFFSSFAPIVNTLEIKKGDKDLAVIDSLYGLFKNASGSVSHMDARIHIENYVGANLESTLCCNDFWIFYLAESGAYKINKPLQEFLEKKIYAAGFR